MRRLLAAAGAAMLSLAVIVPVARATMPDQNDKLDWWTRITYDRQTGNRCDSLSPPTCPPSTAPDGAVVYSTDEIVTVKADFVDGVTGWTVRLEPVNGGAPSTCHEDIAPDNGTYPSVVYINCPWDTTRAVDRTLDTPTAAGDVGDQNLQRNWHLHDNGASVNGKYNIVVTVTNAGRPQGLLTPGIAGGQTFTLYQDTGNPPRWRQVWVNNDVAAPTGVNASFDAGAARINVTWAPNPEPDVSYLLQEKIGDGKWGAPVSVPGNTTNYVRAIGQPGKYQYQVAAVRPAPTADSGNGASATKTSNYVAAQAVNVAQVTPPTTAAGPNGADGTIDHSGDNGVIMPTDAAPSSGPGAPGSVSANGKPAAGGHPSGGGGTTGSRSGGSGGRSSSTGSTAAGGGEAEGEGPDSGFSASLPYQTSDGSTDGLGSGSESPETMGPGFVKVPKPQDARAVLVPLAGALAVFMLAMQLMVWVRRRPAMVTTADDDFDDWMSF